jgi:hypothetical protein
MSQSGSEVLRETADPGPSIRVQSSRLWALLHGRFTKLLFPTHLKADRLGVTLVNVKSWLTPWAREEEHMPMSHLAEVAHDRGLLWDSISIESSGGLNPLQVQGLPKGGAEHFVEQVRALDECVATRCSSMLATTARCPRPSTTCTRWEQR